MASLLKQKNPCSVLILFQLVTAHSIHHYLLHVSVQAVTGFAFQIHIWMSLCDKPIRFVSWDPVQCPMAEEMIQKEEGGKDQSANNVGIMLKGKEGKEGESVAAVAQWLEPCLT